MSIQKYNTRNEKFLSIHYMSLANKYSSIRGILMLVRIGDQILEYCLFHL